MAAKPRAVVIVGILAVAIAAAAAYFLYDYLRMQEKRVSEAVATEEIVVAAKEIRIGGTIEGGQIKTAGWPKANMPQGAIKTKEGVVGRIALQTIVPGDAVTESKLVPKEGPSGVMTYKIPEGHRAMTVGVDQVAGVAGFINPGVMVDVVLTIMPPGKKDTLSKIVLQNIPILAIGQIVEQKGGEPVVVPTVTMDVTPEDAEKLAVAGSQGRLQLVLRRLGDKEDAKTAGATITKVLSGAKYKAEAPRAVRRAPAVEVKKEGLTKPAETFVSVDVLKAGKKETQKFKVQ
jgi:pilus assembly protein CpaB